MHSFFCVIDNQGVHPTLAYRPAITTLPQPHFHPQAPMRSCASSSVASWRAALDFVDGWRAVYSWYCRAAAPGWLEAHSAGVMPHAHPCILYAGYITSEGVLLRHKHARCCQRCQQARSSDHLCGARSSQRAHRARRRGTWRVKFEHAGLLPCTTSMLAFAPILAPAAALRLLCSSNLPRTPSIKVHVTHRRVNGSCGCLDRRGAAANLTSAALRRALSAAASGTPCIMR